MHYGAGIDFHRPFKKLHISNHVHIYYSPSQARTHLLSPQSDSHQLAGHVHQIERPLGHLFVGLGREAGHLVHFFAHSNDICIKKTKSVLLVDLKFLSSDRFTLWRIDCITSCTDSDCWCVYSGILAVKITETIKYNFQNKPHINTDLHQH